MLRKTRITGKIKMMKKTENDGKNENNRENDVVENSDYEITDIIKGQTIA